jgi:hypothetical protein
MRYCNMIGQPYTIYIYKHRDSKPTLHLQEVNFVNFDPFLCISGCFESTLGTSQNWSLQNAWLNCIKSRFQDQEDVAENMVGRDICVIYMDIYISMSPSLHIYISPHLRISLCLYTYILLYNYIYILYIYVYIIIVYIIYVYIYIYIYLHNQYIYVSILDKKPILSIIYIKNVCHGKAGVVTRLSTTKRAKNHWDQPRTWWLRWGLASNPRRCAGCFWSFAWGHSYYANRYDIYIYVYIIYSLSIIYIYIYTLYIMCIYTY